MRQQILVQNFESPFGSMILGDFDGKLCLCDWKYRKQRDVIDNRIGKAFNAEYIQQDSALLKEVKLQLHAYFDNSSKLFNVPLIFAGSDFQKSVWNALLKIPFGSCLSYLQLAEKLDNKLAIRAVAAANGANAISIIVPCHRIIGSDGSMTGYAGGLQAKRNLLTLEGHSEANQYKLFEL
jgi:methylated-DNA-[protein]-cysteine S-methyltransferase